MNILVLNWRDIKNPIAGGAEQLTHEMTTRWVKDGHKVTQISARWNGSKSKEVVDGVNVVRLGTWWTVHAHAFIYYLFHARSKTDIVVDEVHWFPFFARLYTPKKTILLACEVASSRFFEIFPYPIALVWRGIEILYLRMYRAVPTMTISDSTKKELVQHGFNEKNITVLPMGITVPSKISIVPKERRPTIVYLGRLNKLKGAEDAMRAFVAISVKNPDAQMWFIGSGAKTYTSSLKTIARQNQVGERVTFYGFVPQDEKFELLSRAHILVVPSVHEGWGLIVSEAAYVGTPAVVYDVSGLRDTVINGKTGVVVTPTVQALSDGLLVILADTKKLHALSQDAKQHARLQSWDQTARVGMGMIQHIV